MTRRTTERLIDLLETVNATAIDNDGGKPGEFLAALCREAAQRLRDLQKGQRFTTAQDRHVAELAAHVEELGPPLRSFDDTFSATTVIMDKFFPRRNDDGMPIINEGDHGC